MNRLLRPRSSITARLMLLFSLLLVAFTLFVSILYNTLMRRETINHYSRRCSETLMPSRRTFRR